jgi:hypothetical protein
MSITSKNNLIYTALTNALIADGLDVVHTVRSPQGLQKAETPLFYLTLDTDKREFEGEDDTYIDGKVYYTLFAGTKTSSDTADIGKARISIEAVPEQVEKAWLNTSQNGTYTSGDYTYQIYTDRPVIDEIYTYPDEGEARGWIEIKGWINYKRSY